MVQGNPSVRENLGPALLHTYTAVGVFEGLDVDKESFDKYSTRYVCVLTSGHVHIYQIFEVNKFRDFREV